MARMSIDDMFLRDPRVRALAEDMGWSKYEARGRLLDVFAVAYDRVDTGGKPVLTPDEIDGAAEFGGLAVAMTRHRLAVPVRDGLYIKGSDERTRYLSTRHSSGRIGGLKSGESRRKKAKVTFKVDPKVTFEKVEGPVNPSVPDLVPDDPVLTVPDPAPPARAIPQYDAEDPGQRGRLATACWNELRDRQQAIALELGLPAPLPLVAITPGSEPVGFRDLRDRIREEGKQAPEVWLHVLEALTAEARKTRSVEWLSGKSLTEKAWQRARTLVPTWRSRSQPTGPAVKQRFQLASGEEVEAEA